MSISSQMALYMADLQPTAYTWGGSEDSKQESRKLSDKPYVVGQNKIHMKNNWTYYAEYKDVFCQAQSQLQL